MSARSSGGYNAEMGPGWTAARRAAMGMLVGALGLGESVRAAAEAPELAPPVSAPLDDETARILRDLSGQMAQLEQRGALPDDVRGALAEARLALERMSEAQLRRQYAQAARAHELARANLALAERRYSLSVERGLLRLALAHREESRARLEKARAARDAEARRVRELAAESAPSGDMQTTPSTPQTGAGPSAPAPVEDTP